jgi:acyl-CoA synthetase (AMP-forming)/AMP-acid ligase II
MSCFETLDGVIAHWAHAHGQRDAIVSIRGNERICYAELNALIDRFCARYGGEINAGTHCAVLLDDSVVCHALIHTIFRLGAVLVPLDSELGYTSLKSILNHSDARYAFIAEQNGKVPFMQEIPDLKLFIYSTALTTVETPIESITFTPRSCAESTAMLAYTSGTSAAPKGVVLKHRHLLSAYQAATTHFHAPQRVGCVFRMATLGTLGIHFFYPQYSGGTSVILPNLNILNAGGLFNLYEENKLDFLYLVPSLIKMLNHLGKARETPLKGLIASAGAPLQAAEQEEFQQKFGLTLRNIYGLTESSFAVFYGEESEQKGTNSIGKALSVEASVVNDQLGEVEQGVVGELIYRGPMVSGQYYKNESASEATFIEGWLHTGDLVREDSNGNFYIVGRKKDLVIRGGFNIYPAEIEEVIQSYEGVVNVCVFGWENPVKGEELRAIVQIDPAISFSEAIFSAYVRNAVGGFRAPDRYLIQSEELPLNAAGKFDKKTIQQLFNSRISSL